jgi:putative ABC transport system permease protein
LNDWKDEIRSRMAGLWLDASREIEIVEELAQHLEDRYQEFRAIGMSADPAKRRALSELSDDETLRRELRRVERIVRQDPLIHGGGRRNMIGDLWQDLRYGVRMLARNPGFATVAVLTLALGIGANTAIFSVINGVLIKPLPYSEPSGLVRVFGVWPTQPSFPNSPADFVDYRERNEVLSDFAIYIRRDLDLTIGDTPVRLKGMGVSPEFFRVLGFRPMLGRDFLPSEEVRGNNQVAILSQATWQHFFNADPEIVGKSITLSGLPYTVVGVMPSGVQHVGGDYHSLPHGESVEIWSPFPLLPLKRFDREQHYLNGIARLRPGISLEQASSNMNVLAAALEREHPDSNHDARTKLVPLKEEIVGRARPMLLLLFGAAAFVLLIACVNVANLMLARSVARQREIAVRAALGARRSRLVQQLLTESMLIAIIGGAIGSLFAVLGVRALPLLAPDKLPRLQAVQVDLRVLAFTLVCAFITGLLFGLAPALAPLKSGTAAALKEGAHGSSGGVVRARLRSLLVIAETSLALILLVGAGLLMRSFVALRTEDPGFQPDNTLTMKVNLPNSRYPSGDMVRGFYKQLTERVRSLPGVATVGLGSDIPWTGYDENSSFDIEGRPSPPDHNLEARFHFVSPDYFRAIGTPLIAGRFFTEDDGPNSPMVVLVNASFARQFFPGEETVGKRLSLWGNDDVAIVGVVGDVKDTPSDFEAKAAFYWNDRQMTNGGDRLLVMRSKSAPAGLSAAIRSEVLSLDKDLPVTEVKTLDEVANAAVSGARFTLLLVGLFGGLALVLAVIGLYGVMAYSVSQRSREIGIRIALGAERRDILRMVIGKGALLASTGIVIGLGGALGLTRFLQGLLFGVSATDVVVFAVVPLVLAIVALAACYVPARRATRIDPMLALRYE